MTIYNNDCPLDWDGLGYDVYLAPKQRYSCFEQELLTAAFVQAKQGSRELVTRVALEIVGKSKDPIFHSDACSLVGAAGSAQDLELMLQVLAQLRFWPQEQDIVFAIGRRGRLVDVPIIIDFIDRHLERYDVIDGVISRLTLLLCDNDEPKRQEAKGLRSLNDADQFDHWDEYRKFFGIRYFELWNQLGTNLVHLYQGNLFDIDQVAKGILTDQYTIDRDLFESTTGISCAHWYKDGAAQLMTIAADLEDFIHSNRPALQPGQRAFLGHPLEDIAATQAVLDTYPRNQGFGVPEIRTSLDLDDCFEMVNIKWGINFMEYGLESYFSFTNARPPDSTDLIFDQARPWLSLHSCIRQVQAGNPPAIPQIAPLSLAGADFVHIAVIDFLADAADDEVIDQWRKRIAVEEDSVLVFNLCQGLLRRGMLHDVPGILRAYRKHAHYSGFSRIEIRLNEMLAFATIRQNPQTFVGVAICDKVEVHYKLLCDQLGGDHLPVFRGCLYSPVFLANEVLNQQYGPITTELQRRFEASTGIDSTAWDRGHDFDAGAATNAATQFLGSDLAASCVPGQLYFFGKKIMQ